MPAKNALDKFCLKLVNQQATWEQLRTDSRALLKEEGLSADDIKLFTSGTDAAMRAHLGRGPERFSAYIVKPIR